MAYYTVSPPEIFVKERRMLRQHLPRLNTYARQIVSPFTDITASQLAGVAMLVIGAANLYEAVPTFLAAVIYNTAPEWFRAFELLMALMLTGGLALLLWPQSRFRGYFLLPLAAYTLLFVVTGATIKGTVIYALAYVLTLKIMGTERHE